MLSQIQLCQKLTTLKPIILAVGTAPPTQVYRLPHTARVTKQWRFSQRINVLFMINIEFYQSTFST